VFDVKTKKREYRDIELSLLGNFQIENALTAIGVVEGIRDLKIKRLKDLSEDVLYRGLASVKWKGRLEILRRSPYLVIDGAHNPYSMEVLAREVKDIFDYEKLILILGVNRDKSVKEILDAIVPLSDEIIFTRVNFPRSADPFVMRDMVKGRSPMVSKDIKEALGIAYGIATPKDLILVTGSLYLVGEAIKVSSRE